MSTRISNNQTRAQKAWEYANANGAKGDKEYRSYVREFPMLVLNSGLVNAVAFAYEKGKVSTGGKKAWAVIYEQLAKWLGNDCGRSLLDCQDGKLIEALIKIENTNAQQMRLLTNETIILFTWLKRFVSEK